MKENTLRQKVNKERGDKATQTLIRFIFKLNDMTANHGAGPSTVLVVRIFS